MAADLRIRWSPSVVVGGRSSTLHGLETVYQALPVRVPPIRADRIEVEPSDLLSRDRAPIVLVTFVGAGVRHGEPGLGWLDRHR
jgi:hypothetical protein